MVDSFDLGSGLGQRTPIHALRAHHHFSSSHVSMRGRGGRKVRLHRCGCLFLLARQPQIASGFLGPMIAHQAMSSQKWRHLSCTGAHCLLERRATGRVRCLSSPLDRSHQDFRPITPEDFAPNLQFKDESGIPAKQQELERALPGVDIDKLCKEVPDVLLWPPSELQGRLNVLAQAMPGYDLMDALCDAPTILLGTPFLEESLQQFEKWFPGKTLPELMPRCMDGDLGTAPRPFEYPERLDYGSPYLDPGLMGSYAVHNELIEAMRRSQHLTFGLWKEDAEALSKFASAVNRAALAFEIRVEYLHSAYGPEHFERYFADDLYGETVGYVEDWGKKHSTYEGWLEEKLDGYEDLELYRLRRLPPMEKEDMACRARDKGFWGPDAEIRDRKGPGRGISAEVEKDAEDDDGWAGGASQDGGGIKVDEEVHKAMEQALWSFEVRSGFLEQLHGEEAYRNEVIRRVQPETGGTAEEFLQRYSDYAGYLDQVLEGWLDGSTADWASVDVDIKEDQWIAKIKATQVSSLQTQKELSMLEEPLLPDIISENAVESREEHRARLTKEEEERLGKLTDAQVKRHWEAYDRYVKERFPELEERRLLMEEMSDDDDDDDDDVEEDERMLQSDLVSN